MADPVDKLMCSICRMQISSNENHVTCNGCFAYLHNDCACINSETDGIYSCCLSNITLRSNNRKKYIQPENVEMQNACNPRKSLSIFTETQDTLSEKILPEDMQILQNNIAKIFESNFKQLTNSLNEIKSQVSSFKDQIDNNRKDIDTMKSDISSLSAKLHNLEAKLVDSNSSNSANPAASNSESAPSSSSEPWINTTSEIMDRLQRSSNIIIYNLAPQSDTCDKDLVSNCLSNINNINIAEISVKRFKKQSPRSIAPPIIATLSSNVDVKRILKNWKKFPKGIQITPDYTV